MDKLEILKRSDLFRELDDEQLAVIAKMCTGKVFDPGTIICKQGEIERCNYVVEDGLVGIILEVGPMAQRQVQAAANFEVFGWSSMIEPYCSTATVKAIEKTRVLVCDGRKLRTLCDTHPEIACKLFRGVAQIVAARLRQAYIQLLGITAQD
ncbi:Crp/Fnr family transcriptional regulator [Chloroflexota bacterium]